MTDTTYRLGTYMAIVFGVQFFAHLVGIGVDGVRIELLHLFYIWAALAMRDGALWGRLVLIVAALVVAVAAVVFLASNGASAWVLVSAAYAALVLAALWSRPWANTQTAHMVILVVGVVGALMDGV